MSSTLKVLKVFILILITNYHCHSYFASKILIPITDVFEKNGNLKYQKNIKATK